MGPLVGRRFGRRALPQHLAGLAIDGEDDEAMGLAWGDAAARRMRILAGCPHGHGREQKYLITPDDRRRRPAARDLDLPANVLLLAPLERRVRVPRDAGGFGPAPHRPVPISRGVHL